MIPVTQTMTVARDGTGDCFNACVASILHIPIETTHHILPNSPGVWFLNWRRWLKDQGYHLHMTSKLKPPEGYSIVSILTDRIYLEGHEKAGKRISHACVALDGKIVHDPFPEPSVVCDIQYYFALDRINSGELNNAE